MAKWTRKNSKKVPKRTPYKFPMQGAHYEAAYVLRGGRIVQIWPYRYECANTVKMVKR